MWGLLFLLPVLGHRSLVHRGLIFGLAPTLEITVLHYTILQGRGLLGTGTSIWLPILALVFWVAWGGLTGYILGLFGGGR